MFSPTPFNTLHMFRSKKYSLSHPGFVGVSFPQLDCRIIGHSSAQICFCSARLDGECRWTAISGLTADFQGWAQAVPLQNTNLLYLSHSSLFLLCALSLCPAGKWIFTPSIAFRLIFVLDCNRLFSSSWWKIIPRAWFNQTFILQG